MPELLPSAMLEHVHLVADEEGEGEEGLGDAVAVL